MVKSFHQAKRHIYIAQGVLDRAISFITNNQNYDGSFKRIGSVHDTMLKVRWHVNVIFAMLKSCKVSLHLILSVIETSRNVLDKQ